MTFGQYKRLLLIVAVPLVIAGVAFAELFLPYPKNFMVLLCQRSPDSEYCRTFDDMSGSFYDSVHKQSPVWFDVMDAPAKKPTMTYLASGDVRVLKGSIIGAVPHALNPQTAAADMNQLIGKKADFVLGIKSGESSNIVGDSILLRCNGVRYLPDGNYASPCYADNWDGIVTYSATGESAAMLQRLRDGVNEKITAWENDLLIYRAVCYSMFLVGFLLISGVVWLIIRASRYVRAG